MKIDYLFSRPRKKKIGASLIRWASRKEFPELEWKDVPSHIAVLMNDTFVVESTLTTGVRVIPYYKWLELNVEICKIPCNEEYRPSKEVFECLMDVWGKKYDWYGIAFFSYAFVGNIYFDKPMPKTNEWQRDSHFFCTEFAGRLTGEDFSMHTPARMMVEWLDASK